MTLFADTHCHLDLYQDMMVVARECELRSIRIITVTNLPSTWEALSKRLANYKCIRVALGLHPQLAAENSLELSLFLRFLSKARYIGEIGLDGSKEAAATLSQQKKVFEAILSACAEQQRKIISIHSRGAVNDVLDMVEKYSRRDNGIILHWFTGTAKQMFRAVELGCYFSVNPQMVKSQSGIKLISQIPTERILTETDGPFTRFGRDPAMPWHVVNVATALSSIWCIETKAANEIIAGNFKRLLKSVPM